ncbi:MAG: hypothetical protein ABI462_05020 [Ignavibacteria bacterium]
MLKSKFLDIVKTFTPEELKGFRNFVRSPFHNSNKNVIKVTDIVSKHYPDLSHTRLEKENIFKKIYPGKKYNDAVMRIILSDLLQLSEEFLMITNLTNDPVKGKKLLLNELNKRNLHTLFKRQSKIAEDMLAQDGLIDMFYFHEKFDVQTMKIDNMISQGRQPEIAGDALKQGEYLINFFLISILNIAHELRTHREVLNVDFDFNLVEKFLNSTELNKYFDYCRENNYEFYSILMIYYYMYLSMNDHENEEYLFKLKELVYKNLHLFKREEQFNLFVILESICTSFAMIGSNKHNEYLMDIYEMMLAKNIYTHTETDFFQLNLFRNMFYTAHKLKRFVWVEQFINEYIDKILPKYREDVKHLAFAYIYFDKNEYDKALAEITQVNYNYFVFKFDVRILTLKIYYQMGSYETALSLIDSFSHFLMYNKSAESYRESFLIFLKFVRELIKFRSGSDKKEIGEIRKEINDTKILLNKDWLLEKTEELDN